MKTIERMAYVVMLASLPALLAGCGGPATFVSDEPPPDAAGDAWFLSPIPSVRSAMKQAMIKQGMTIDPSVSTPTRLVGTKPQTPYVDEEAGGPAAGPLPVYVFKAVLSRPGDTHARVTVRAEMSGVSAGTPYEWEYPRDLMKRTFERTREILHERRIRYTLPPRPRVRPWHPRPR